MLTSSHSSLQMSNLAAGGVDRGVVELLLVSTLVVASLSVRAK